MSYRLDADVYLPYYGMKFVYDQLRKGKEAIDEIIRKKTGIAVGFCIYWSCIKSNKYVTILLVNPLNNTREHFFGHAVLHEIFQMIIDRLLMLIPNLKSVLVYML